MLILTTKDTKDYLRAINAGIDNSIGLLDSLPIKDEKVLDQNAAKPQEEISKEDSGKLQNIIEHNQGATK